MADREITDDELDVFEDMDFEEEIYGLDDIDPRLIHINNCG